LPRVCAALGFEGAAQLEEFLLHLAVEPVEGLAVGVRQELDTPQVRAISNKSIPRCHTSNFM